MSQDRRVLRLSAEDRSARRTGVGNRVNQPSPSRPVGLDAVDRRLLRVLAEDARIPDNVLPARVGIPPTSPLRLRRLVSTGVVRGPPPRPGPSAPAARVGGGTAQQEQAPVSSIGARRRGFVR